MFHRWLRSELRGGLVAVGLLSAVFGGGSEAWGATVGVFAAPGVSDTAFEAWDVVAALGASGDEVVRVSSLSSAVLRGAVVDLDVLVVAQYEAGSMLGGSASESYDVLYEYVSSGGGLVVAGERSSRGLTLLNRVFDLGFEYTRDPGLSELGLVDASGVFASGPEVLGVDSSALAKATRVDGAGLEMFYGVSGWSGAFGGEVGAGRFVHLGVVTRGDAGLGEDDEAVLGLAAAYALGEAGDPVVIPLPGSVWAGIVLLMGFVSIRVWRRRMY